ncbi:MAG TPA: hypothetical protein VFL47_09590, partial [Flavisolibacter sp.]|nr:hypothetical protein [Flavisolibacter sp.]
ESTGGNPPVDPGTGETATKKLIPDSVFRAYLKANVCPTAFDASGKYIDITNSEVKNFSGTMTLDTITCPKPFVASLKGVEYFTKMSKLIVKNSLVDSLVLKETMALDTLQVLINKDLQYLDVSGCTNMRFVRVSDMPATSINLSNLPKLEYANLIELKRVSQVKTDNSPKLRHLMTYGMTSLKSVDVSSNANLGRLYFESCTGLTSIDVTHNPKLYDIVATYSGLLKTVDLSKNDSLRFAKFDDCGIDTIDFSHNRNLLSVAMFRTKIRNLDMRGNPDLRLLYLDGCGFLKTVDLRAQKTFDYYFIEFSKYFENGEDEGNRIYQNGFVSPVQTSQHVNFGQATRKGVNGATMDLYAGLRLPAYLDANFISLTEVKVNKAVKDNYSLVMARRVLPSQTPALIKVYDDDQTTVLCPDYDPLLFKCN